jgi:molybdopterin synthase sulfur carrier subunit
VIRVLLPPQLRELAGLSGEVRIPGPPPDTQAAVLDQLEALHPTLRGTIRDPGSGRRRPYLRFFADGVDVSHDEPHGPLPEAVLAGREPFVVVTAISGG